MEKIDIDTIIIAYEVARMAEPGEYELTEQQQLINEIMTDEVVDYIERYTKAYNDYNRADEYECERVIDLADYNVHNLAEDHPQYNDMYQDWLLAVKDIEDSNAYFIEIDNNLKSIYEKYEKIVVDKVNELLVYYERLQLTKWTNP